jgi:hypothetical protein
MPWTINTKPQTLTPVYNPVQFDLTNSTANWVYTNYVLLPYDDSGVNLPAVDFKKSNVYNSTYSYLDFSTTLQDYLTIQNPNLVNRLTPTGSGWIRRFYGVVYDNTLPLTYEFLPMTFVFNGVLKRDLFLEYRSTDLIANSLTGGGRFLTDFPTRNIRFESTAIADVVNGQFENDTKNLTDTDYEYTDYHNIKIKNTNSSGLFYNNLLRVTDDPTGVRYLTFLVFFGSVNTKFAEGDVIAYTTNINSEVFDYYSSSLDGQYTIQKVEELSISPTTSIYSISVRVNPSIPTTFSLIGNDNMNDIGTITLVTRAWSFYNRYYESSQYDPRAYNLENPGAIYTTTFNKKLTFPTGPVNLRKSMGKRYIQCNSEIIGGTTYVKLTLDEPHQYEVGDKVIHLPQVFANTSSIKCYGEFNIIEINNNEITIDLLYSDFPNPNGSGVIWNYIKDGLVKSVKKVVNDVSIRVDPVTNQIEFDVNITARIAVPDKFVITITNYGDMPFTIPSAHLIESIRTYPGVLDENSIISFVSRTDVDRMVGYSTTIKNALKANTYTNATIVIHHQIASNKGYSPILGYNGAFTDEYYNSPVNSDVDQYNFQLERIVSSGPPVLLGSESYLTYNLDKRCSKYDLIDIMWLNNHGTYDFFTFNWKKTQSREYQRNRYRKTAGSFDGTSYNYSNLDRELTDYQITTDTTGILYSDWVSETEYNRLLEIFDSPIIYLYENDKYTPIVIENDEIEEKTLKNDKIFNISINFRVSFNEKSIRI